MKKSIDGFIRDPNSGAVLNVDNTALAQYKARKAKNREVEDLKKEVTELKTMIQAILMKLEK